MSHTKPFAVTFNPGQRTCSEIVLADSAMVNWPFLSALLIFHNRTSDTANGLKDYQFHPTIDLSIYWQRLLDESRLPDIHSIPPEMLDSLPSTFDIQASHMLLQYATARQTTIKVYLPKKPTTSVALSLIAKPVATTSKALKVPIGPNPELIHVTSVPTTTDAQQKESPQRLSTKTDRELMAYFYRDHHYFESRPNPDSLIYQLWVASTNPSAVESDSLTDLIDQHYLNAYRGQNDRIILDKRLQSSPSSFAELLYANAHIRCSLPFSAAKLSAVLNANPNAVFWQACLKVYAQRSIAYSTNTTVNTMICKHLREGYHLARALGDPHLLVRSLHGRSSYLTMRQRYDRAISLLGICLTIRTQLEDYVGIAKISNGLAYIHLQMDQWQSALQCYRDALFNLQKAENIQEEALTLCHIGWLQLLKGDSQPALEATTEALDLMDTHEITTLAYRTRPDLYAQLGLCYYFLGNIEQAIHQADHCEAHKIDSSHNGEVLRTLLRGLINMDRGNSHLAELSFHYLPELLSESSEQDIHLTLLCLREKIHWCTVNENIIGTRALTKEAQRLCIEHHLTATHQWFKS